METKKNLQQVTIRPTTASSSNQAGGPQSSLKIQVNVKSTNHKMSTYNDNATPILGLQEDAANTTCDHWPLAPYQPCHFVSFLPGEYIVQPTPVWCSLSM